MKRNYVMMAMAAAMLASCAQTGLVEEIAEEPQKAIGFSTFADKTTRAISDPELEKYHQTFGVWAYKTYDGTETPVMNHYQVTSQGTGSGTNGWHYDGTDGLALGQVLRYWDTRATYAFYAYAPFNKDNVLINSATKKISIQEGEYAANENLQKEWSTSLNANDFTGIGTPVPDKSTDWMIADNQTGILGSAKPLVTENFKHTLSKLIVKVKIKESFTKNITVNSISLSHVHGEGRFDGEKWQRNDNFKAIIEGVAGVMEPEKNYYSMEYLVMPITINETQHLPKFNINYTIDDEVFDVQNANISAITALVANTVYTITVTVGPDPIHFDATVTDWPTPGASGSVTIL